MSKRPDETWHRLREWTYGQALSERLAAQVLLADGYKNLDPSHPLGGPDGRRDAVADRDGKKWIMAVHFPRGQQRISAIKKKFRADLAGVEANGADGIAFVTNQELTVTERNELAGMTDKAAELYHLERCVAVLDQPRMGPVRRQFHLEDENAEARQRATITGGDTYAHVMLYHFDLVAAVAQQFTVIKDGEYPLYNVTIRIVDMDTGQQLYTQEWGDLDAPAYYGSVKWRLKDENYLRAFFTARNGQWHQDLLLMRSDQDRCWLAATRVFGLQQAPDLQHIDNKYRERFGEPVWRS
ncbi:hypothetical protein [Nocardia iowensis]|uniref:Restriction endonuclease type IV Mrr domain-containing protein n=1 Tax=Nocardia iowensis TaxID=204891 RepID=A0ABX8RQG1_NOCIO|nr:hypothetical protein [Nocardia iowensis]QXN91885.1 hypothetical protein KV110_01440 [Nocardia iowensis]